MTVEAELTVPWGVNSDWRRPLSSSPDAIPRAATYARILSLFLDDPSPLSPFSVHQFARQGKQLGKEIGEWFGPSTAAGAIKTLVNAYEPAGLRVVSCIDGTVYESEVVEASTVEGTSWKRPVLVLVNVRLGLEGVNPVYHESIKVSRLNMRDRVHAKDAESLTQRYPAERVPLPAVGRNRRRSSDLVVLFRRRPGRLAVLHRSPLPASGCPARLAF